jgi:hypothetical protein
MIAISLWQPWASALFAPRPGGMRVPVKQYETRGWQMPPKYVGKPVAIHAAKRRTDDEREFWRDTVMRDPALRAMYAEAFRAIGIKCFGDLPLGAIIGEVVFAGSIPTEKVELDSVEQQWGNYSAGRWAWPTTERKVYDKPIPCIGRQGFFFWGGPGDSTFTVKTL